MVGDEEWEKIRWHGEEKGVWLDFARFGLRPREWAASA